MFEPDQHSLYQALDIFFLIFHTLFTLFNLTAWAWRKTRPLHRITMGLTAASWFIFGYWYGWGYCFCTDWHWTVRERLGNPIVSHSYIHFLILELTGVNLNPALVDYATMGTFSLLIILTLFFSVKDFPSLKGPGA
jgi:hypothetical protein